MSSQAAFARLASAMRRAVKRKADGTDPKSARYKLQPPLLTCDTRCRIGFGGLS